MSPGENKAIARNYIDPVWNHQNLAVIDEVIPADYNQHIQGVPPGRDGVKLFFKGIRTAFPDIGMTVEDMIAEGDKVVWRFSQTGTHRGAFRGIPATGKQIRMTGFAMVRMENGQFVEARGEQDLLGLMQQPGVIQKG